MRSDSTMGSRRLSRRGSPSTALVNGEELGCKCSWASGRLEWSERPRNILIIGKRSKEVTEKILELSEWLVKERDMTVFVEAWRGMRTEPRQRHTLANGGEEQALGEGAEGTKVGEEALRGWMEGSVVEVGLTHPTPELLLMLREEVDFAVCLGGDGTLLYFNSFFPTSVPPVICVNYTGSLGFVSGPCSCSTTHHSVYIFCSHTFAVFLTCCRHLSSVLLSPHYKEPSRFYIHCACACI